ncbi:MAG TPA: hypothetical protein P5058_03515, partial [Eubacteriales bacterium]|nr:hypothetical protein [Eubacteriales bacterium]
VYRDGYAYFKASESGTYIFIAKDIFMSKTMWYVFIGGGAGVIILSIIFASLGIKRARKKADLLKLAQQQKFEDDLC